MVSLRGCTITGMPYCISHVSVAPGILSPANSADRRSPFLGVGWQKPNLGISPAHPIRDRPYVFCDGLWTRPFSRTQAGPVLGCWRIAVRCEPIIAAKHEGMNENVIRQSRTADAKSQLTRVARLLLRTRDSLHSALGSSPTYPELEEWTGMAEGTIKDWCNNKGRPIAEFVLQLLERVPEKQRHEILDSACRVFPTLDHPRLKCDQTIISRLKTMVSQPRGVVFIQGGNDESRTFLLTAMGYAFLGLTARPHRLVGLDAHEPDWFVPLPGVRYLPNMFQPAKLLQAAKDNWPKVQFSGARLVVFNGTGVVLGGFHRQVKSLTGRCSVIVAEAAQLKPSLVKRASHGPVHIVTVSKHPENGKGIDVAIEAI